MSSISSLRESCSSIVSSAQNLITRKLGARANDFLVGIEQTADTLTKLFKGSVYACTSCLGFRERSLQIAKTSLHEGGDILAQIYSICLQCINPDVSISGPVNQVLDTIGGKFETSLQNIKAQSLDKQNWQRRNVYARVDFVALAIFSTAHRSLAAVVSAVALPFSLLSAAISIFTDKASCPKLHEAALSGLFAPRIIHDLFICTIGFIYPSNLSSLPKQ
jgi:hypothetical protein